MLIINPGTEGRAGATEANARMIADGICKDLGLPPETAVRAPERDVPDQGWFGFNLRGVDLDIPGDDPAEFFRSEPFRSRRMYVDGSSWLYKYAIGMIVERLK